MREARSVVSLMSRLTLVGLMLAPLGVVTVQAQQQLQPMRHEAQGVVERVDWGTRTLRVHQRDFRLAEDVAVHGLPPGVLLRAGQTIGYVVGRGAGGVGLINEIWVVGQ